jgi:hypothetical protein
MPNISWHNYLMICSFAAAIAGLLLLIDKNPATDDREIVDRILFRMVFAYWLVYCVAFALQRLISEEWQLIVISIRFTGIISYLLTLTCVLSLPLHRLASRQQTE